MSLVIFDTEYTTWQGCLEHGWKDKQKKEIVQIAALKVSDDLNVLDEFNILCKPTINPVLSDYFINLTHIDNNMINKHGILFSEAYRMFIDFVGTDICYSHAWGADFYNKSDGLVMEENLALYKIAESNNITYRNIAAVFAKLYQDHNMHIKSQCSGQIAQILGIEKNLTKLGLDIHNALYDVYSILEGLKYFYPKSMDTLKDLENIA